MARTKKTVQNAVEAFLATVPTEPENMHRAWFRGAYTLDLREPAPWTVILDTFDADVNRAIVERISLEYAITAFLFPKDMSASLPRDIRIALAERLGVHECDFNNPKCHNLVAPGFRKCYGCSRIVRELAAAKPAPVTEPTPEA